MSTLRVDTLQDRLGSGQPSMPGAARAWVNFNGTGTVAIRAAFNVTSITDNGVGDYTLNYTNALASANSSVAGVVSRSAAGTRGTIVDLNPTTPLTTTTARIRSITVDTKPTPADAEFITAQVFA